MSSRSDFLESDVLRSSMWGVLRGIAVDTLIYPLDVVRIQQQCTNDSKKCWMIAKKLFQDKGYSTFYRGISPQLLRTGMKQVWCWPMITGMPPLLNSYCLNGIQQQIITGVSIATVDAIVTTPLEKLKIFSILTRKIPFSFVDVYQKGWQGFSAYWAKRSINMVTFLIAQHYFRECNRKQNEELEPLLLIKTGTQVALAVSLVGAPFDMVNTIKQAHNVNFTHLFSRHGLAHLYRGAPLFATSLIIHNIASVLVIEKLTRK
ncbi:MAG: MC/SLC25 family protein [Chlamydiota bacterium]